MVSNIQQKIEVLVLPILERMGYKLWGCQCLLHQKQRLLRIFIDKQGGIVLSDCEQVSHALSAALDVDNVIEDHYRLEISSPGLPKPLFYPWQYQENLGKTVRLKLIRVIEDHRWLEGTVVAVEQDNLSLQTQEKVFKILWTNISKAHLESENQ